MKKDYKAFCNHVINGVRLAFPNGNAISTIWGRGTYSENHDYESGKGVFEDYREPIEDGSNTAEIMILNAPDTLFEKIYKHQNADTDNGVIGWVNMTDWLWIINQLSKPIAQNK
jgi:hypothetical protein